MNSVKQVRRGKSVSLQALFLPHRGFLERMGKVCTRIKGERRACGGGSCEALEALLFHHRGHLETKSRERECKELRDKSEHWGRKASGWTVKSNWAHTPDSHPSLLDGHGDPASPHLHWPGPRRQPPPRRATRWRAVSDRRKWEWVPELARLLNLGNLLHPPSVLGFRIKRFN